MTDSIELPQFTGLPYLTSGGWVVEIVSARAFAHGIVVVARNRSGELVAEGPHRTASTMSRGLVESFQKRETELGRPESAEWMEPLKARAANVARYPVPAEAGEELSRIP